jgi:hypothetical protein
VLQQVPHRTHTHHRTHGHRSLMCVSCVCACVCACAVCRTSGS